MSRTDLLKPVAWIWNQLLRWRWGIVAVTTPTVLAALILREGPARLSALDSHFLLLAFAYGLVIPVLVATILGLIHTKSKKSRSAYIQGLYQALGQDTALAQDWDHVTMTLYKLILQLLPIRDLSLSLYDPSLDGYKLVSECGDGKLQLQNDSCLLESRWHLTSEGDKSSHAVLCRCREQASKKQINKICLLLSMENEPTAVLSLSLPRGYSPQPTQEEFLNAIALELAYFIDYFQLKQWAHEHAKSLKGEQDRIAQHLHDTLGDNLAYLRLKLDQLSEEMTFKEATRIHQEIERLRDIANISYMQVRSSLTELRGDAPTDLTSALHECAQIIGGRANFKVHFSSQGEPQDLLPHIQRKVLYVFREAFRNVERHAQASQVSLKLAWNKNWLKIASTDDGEGFDVNKAIKLKSHYGLNMIKEMTEELKGDLSIESSSEKGTKLVLRMPLTGKTITG
jgi:nitrate/nitrite-specific signal transduction histidine kinase